MLQCKHIFYLILKQGHRFISMTFICIFRIEVAIVLTEDYQLLYTEYYDKFMIKV